MKKLMAKYNYAFGYVKGYFTLCGLVGIGAIVAGIILMMQGQPKEAAWRIIGLGAVVVLVALVIVLTTRRKCPEDKRGLIGLTLSMMLVGVAGFFLMLPLMMKWFFKLLFSIIGIDMGSSSSSTVEIASIYYKNTDEFDEYACNSTNGKQIVLRSLATGNYVDVWLHRGNVLTDGNGNLYHPK